MTDSGGNITTMSDQEYTDGYEAEHPELIPGNRTEAHLRVSVALSESLEKCSKETFLRGWWAFCWLNPGFHPDDFRQWDDANGQHFATEAFRRCEAGEIEDDLVYAAEATHNAVWLERRGDPSASLAFKDGYTPQYPELIPANEAEAESRLNEISRQMGEPEVARDGTRLIQLNDEYQETETKLQSLYAEWDRVAADAPKV